MSAATAGGAASPSTARALRLKPLDILRGVAVVLVIGHHKDVGKLLTVGGWCGVDLFFVLSGFLVSGLLFEEYRREGRLKPLRFLIRRGFKIYPSFWVLIAATVAFTVWQKGRLPGRISILTELVFLQNYLYPLWTHTWSLAVEEHFYFLLPLLLLLLQARRRGAADPFKPVVFAYAAMAAGTLALRAVNFLRHPYTYETHHYPTHLRIDALLFGSVLAYLHHFHGPRLTAFARARGPLLALVGLALVAPCFFVAEESFAMNVFGLLATYLGFGAILLWALHAPAPAWKPVRALGAPLAFVGFYSYTIYLWHLPVRDALDAQLKGKMPFAAEVALCFAASIAAGWLASKIVETPFLRLRDRLFPKGAETSRAAVSAVAKAATAEPTGS